jgi:catechol 2,3-dioxygenase-like lactoylglutathione lyase family enzyme
MALSGIDAVTFGVSDMEESKRFLDDWGVTPVAIARDRLEYRTLDGGQVVVRPKEASDLPPAIETANTVREVVWGADEARELDETLERLVRYGATITSAEGMATAADPNGLTLGFRESRRQILSVTATAVNGPGAPARFDRRSPIHERARPVKIGHVVLFANDYQAMRAFYTEALGFIISDEYPGHGVFLRPRVRGEHHHLFILNRPGRPGVNHVAFTVSDIHEVIGGGIAMSKKGWKTEIGPGRHPISSAYFWYFHNPLGAPVEYYADDDYLTEAWRPGTFERKPELFAEWAINGGIDGKTRRQVATGPDSDRGHA